MIAPVAGCVSQARTEYGARVGAERLLCERGDLGGWIDLTVQQLSETSKGPSSSADSREPLQLQHPPETVYITELADIR